MLHSPIWQCWLAPALTFEISSLGTIVFLNLLTQCNSCVLDRNIYMSWISKLCFFYCCIIFCTNLHCTVTVVTSLLIVFTSTEYSPWSFVVTYIMFNTFDKPLRSFRMFASSTMNLLFFKNISGNSSFGRIYCNVRVSPSTKNNVGSGPLISKAGIRKTC